MKSSYKNYKDIVTEMMSSEFREAEFEKMKAERELIKLEKNKIESEKFKLNKEDNIQTKVDEFLTNIYLNNVRYSGPNFDCIFEIPNERVVRYLIDSGYVYKMYYNKYTLTKAGLEKAKQLGELALNRWL